MIVNTCTSLYNNMFLAPNVPRCPVRSGSVSITGKEALVSAIDLEHTANATFALFFFFFSPHSRSTSGNRIIGEELHKLSRLGRKRKDGVNCVSLRDLWKYRYSNAPIMGKLSSSFSIPIFFFIFTYPLKAKRNNRSCCIKNYIYNTHPSWGNHDFSTGVLFSWKIGWFFFFFVC